MLQPPPTLVLLCRVLRKGACAAWGPGVQRGGMSPRGRLGFALWAPPCRRSFPRAASGAAPSGAHDARPLQAPSWGAGNALRTRGVVQAVGVEVGVGWVAELVCSALRGEGCGWAAQVKAQAQGWAYHEGAAACTPRGRHPEQRQQPGQPAGWGWAAASCAGLAGVSAAASLAACGVRG